MNDYKRILKSNLRCKVGQVIIGSALMGNLSISSIQADPEVEQATDIANDFAIDLQERQLIRAKKILNRELLRAIEQGSLKGVQFLVEHGADPNVKDNFDWPILHLAEQLAENFWEELDRQKIVDFLIDWDPNQHEISNITIITTARKIYGLIGGGAGSSTANGGSTGSNSSSGGFSGGSSSGGGGSNLKASGMINDAKAMSNFHYCCKKSESNNQSPPMSSVIGSAKDNMNNRGTGHFLQMPPHSSFSETSSSKSGMMDQAFRAISSGYDACRSGGSSTKIALGIVEDIATLIPGGEIIKPIKKVITTASKAAKAVNRVQANSKKPVTPKPVASKPVASSSFSKKVGQSSGETGNNPSILQKSTTQKNEPIKTGIRKSPVTPAEKAVAYENIKSQLNRLFGSQKKIEGKWYWVNEKGNPINIDRLHYDHYHVLDKKNIGKVIKDVYINWEVK
ncbi:MAG: ankyrin repeat domain-containing protein [Puniceicoccales bacterium]|nr:ankyrin repeat domain-containing protein [Puniceicoccales bacterium]